MEIRRLRVKYVHIFIALCLVVGIMVGCQLISQFVKAQSDMEFTYDVVDAGLHREVHRYAQEVFNSPLLSWNVTGDIDCTKVVDGDLATIARAKTVMSQNPRQGISASDYAGIDDCSNYTFTRGFLLDNLTNAEADFPLAFGIVVYKDVELAERLLRMIYRPHNYYCFHVDAKADTVVKEAFVAIADCFPNVFVVEQPTEVTWGSFTVLEAELLLMEALWRYKWKYYINLTGHEFPLKTNLELVEILKAMKGANVAFGMRTRSKTEFKWRYEKAGPPPHNIDVIVGSAHVAVNRDFVDFCLHDYRSQDFLEWLKKTTFSEEIYFGSLNHNPHLGIPGTFLGEAEEYPKKPFFARYKNWRPKAGIYHRKCFGKVVRDVCILSVGDIHKAVDDIGLFANKFFLDYEYLGLDCLEKYMYERTWDQYLHPGPVDVTYYTLLDQVKYQMSEVGCKEFPCDRCPKRVKARRRVKAHFDVCHQNRHL